MGDESNDTAERLVSTAVDLFARRWYSSVSVAEICREAGCSNGIFYRYFANKETLFRRILEDTIERIALALDTVHGSTRRERLAALVETLCDFTASNRKLITVFREGQYRYFEYERRLIDLYRRTLDRVTGRGAGLAEYLFAFGGLRFSAVRAALHGSNVSRAAITDIMDRGVFRGMGWDPEAVFGITVTPPTIAAEENARDRLLRAGKRLFGERGFHEVSIHQVTDAAGMSVGAFYLNFASKEAFFEELMDAAGKQVRHFISANLRPGLNRIEREMQGIFLFGIFLSIDRWCYNLVREGEFVAPEKAREYYRAFERGYRKADDPGLDPAMTAADPAYEDSAIEFMLGISHYYGIEVLFDESPRSARAVVEGIGACLASGLPRAGNDAR